MEKILFVGIPQYAGNIIVATQPQFVEIFIYIVAVCQFVSCVAVAVLCRLCMRSDNGIYMWMGFHLICKACFINNFRFLSILFYMSAKEIRRRRITLYMFSGRRSNAQRSDVHRVERYGWCCSQLLLVRMLPSLIGANIYIYTETKYI